MGIFQSLKAYEGTSAINERGKQAFVKQLKQKYRQWYDAVQPIPYIRDRLHCVDRVFVEGGIEYFNATYEPLGSYHAVFVETCAQSSRRVLVGEPGYGKSTLTLQYAYDWCNNVKESYLRDVEILILLRLRQLGEVTSIYKAIRRFLLPRDSILQDHDIESILRHSSSVVVILDGFDEYPGDVGDCTSDVMKIIMTHMFKDFEVILTTRYLPEQFPPITKLFRLTGFDDKARNEYIQKAVVGNDVEAANKILERFQENPVLDDLCRVPLLFVMSAHMCHENENFQTFETVTRLFQYMIECFHSHMRNKMEETDVKKCYLYEEHHGELDKVAFEGLSKERQQIAWPKHELVHRLGQDFYNQYIKLGILVEEEFLDDIDGSSSITSDQNQRHVRFYHKTFCEWYAAHYLAKYARRCEDPDSLKAYLRHMDPWDLQYCYRFACGLVRNAASKIIECVKSRKGGEKFAILCILEQGGQIDNILRIVEDLCEEGIEFKYCDNQLLKRSTFQVLEIASSQKISISRLSLINCFSTVDLSGGNYLQLNTNLSIPVLTTLENLAINAYTNCREITTEEFAGILQYSSKCLALQELKFRYCLLPYSVQAESVSVLRSRRVEVKWQHQVDTVYLLNLTSGRWERYAGPGGNGSEMTDEYYKTVAKYIRNMENRW